MSKIKLGPIATIKRQVLIPQTDVKVTSNLKVTDIDISPLEQKQHSSIKRVLSNKGKLALK
jgi:hypothetical protein